MYWDIVSVAVTNKHTLQVSFKDGLKGELEFKDSFFEGVFSDLTYEENFNQVTIEHGAITWPGERDLAPDAMHHEIKKNGKWVLH